MKAILKHELRTCLHSMTAYIFCAFMLLFVGIGALIYNIQYSVANFEFVLASICIGLTVIVPVLTMRTLAEEKKQKTDQLLYSLPLKTTDIIMGKYLALLIVFCVPMAIISFYPLIFGRYGEVYLPTSYGSLLAFVFLGAALLSVGMFISSLTENQGFAAGIAIPVLLFNYYSVKLAEYVSATAFGSLVSICVIILLLGALIRFVTKNENLAFGVTVVLVIATGIAYYFKSDAFEGLLGKVMKTLSLFERFYSFTNGVFDVTALVFYVTVAVFFLFLTVQSVEKRRYN